MHKHHNKHVTPVRSGSTEPATMKQTAAPGEERHNGHLVTPEEIQLCAYRKWESAGRPTGDGFQFWLEAEQELANGKSITGSPSSH